MSTLTGLGLFRFETKMKISNGQILPLVKAGCRFFSEKKLNAHVIFR